MFFAAVATINGNHFATNYYGFERRPRLG